MNEQLARGRRTTGKAWWNCFPIVVLGGAMLLGAIYLIVA
jgi:hypothetical protein